MRPPAWKMRLEGHGVAAERCLAFAAAAGLCGYLALEGGAYDIVVRQSAALVIWALVAAGFLAGVLPRGEVSRWALVPAVAAAGLVGWMLLSFGWTESDERTTEEVARLLAYLGVMTLAVSGLTRRTASAAAAGLSVAVLAVSGLAVASRLDPSLIPEAGNVARLFEPDRLDYPLDYWNAVGAWGAMGVALALSWSVHARLTAVRAVSLACAPLAATCVYLTYSRGGVLGLAVAVVIVLALSRNRWTALAHSLVAAGTSAGVILVASGQEQIAEATGGAGGGTVALALAAAGLVCAATATATSLAGADRLRLSRRAAYVALAAGGVALLLAVAFPARGPVSEAWDEFRTEDQAQTGPSRLATAGGNRRNLWASAVDAFREEPVQGLGAGTYEFWWSRDARDEEYVRNAHSLYLESLAETGAPGFLLLLLLLGGSLGTALYVRGRSDGESVGTSVAMCAVFVIFLVNAGVDWIWQVGALGVVGLGAIAIAIADGSTPLPSRRPQRLLPSALQAAMAVTAILAGAAQVPGLLAAQQVRASQEAARGGDLSRSLSLAEEAVDAMPWGATPYEQLALVEETRGELAAAERNIREAIDREPTNWRYPLALARIQAERGERAAAAATFERGRRLRPHSPSYSPYSPYARIVYTDAQLERIWRLREREEP